MKGETKIPVSMDRHHVTTLFRVSGGVSTPFLFHHQTEGSNSMATNFLLISWKQELESSVTYEISHYRGTTVRHLHYKMLLHKTTPLCKCPFSTVISLFGAFLMNHVCITVRLLVSLSIIHSFSSSYILPFFFLVIENINNQ
jgi:hypothetical protein